MLEECEFPFDSRAWKIAECHEQQRNKYYDIKKAIESRYMKNIDILSFLASQDKVF